jgi:integrase
MPKAANGRPRKGVLARRAKGWFARLTVGVDGVSIRKWFDLETTDEAAAKRKMARLVKTHPSTSTQAIAEAARILETYDQAAERVRSKRRAEGVRDVANEAIRDKLYLSPAIGSRDVRTIRAADIRAVLETAAEAGKSHKTLTHVRMAANTVFDALWREELIPENPVTRVRVPKVARDNRERAVLTDAELAIYLAWEHPEERYRKAALERQIMSIMSRTFGGVRTGDLHALRWEALDTNAGAFTFGWAPRKKTARPQKLEIPAMLRPFLNDWWQRHGKRGEGLVFPALRGDEAGKGPKRGVSHAEAFRRDLARAFIAAREQGAIEAPAQGSQRWRELFEETEHTKPVDFHSWRRAYNQALADAGANAQQAAALAGHADLGAHMRYLNNTSKMRALPAGALPDLIVSSAALPKLVSNDDQNDQAIDATTETKSPASTEAYGASSSWLRGPDLNRRPSGYEPDELPGCSTPR